MLPTPPFKVVDRQETGDNVVVLTFEPADNTPYD